MDAMNGIGEGERGATVLLHQKLSASRVGLRWERLLRSHSHELAMLMAVHTDLREHVAAALTELAEADRTRCRLDEQSVATLTRVLDDLRRLGGFELTRTAGGLGDELELARGHSLDDLLAS
jgi:hypothetical protein